MKCMIHSKIFQNYSNLNFTEFGQVKVKYCYNLLNSQNIVICQEKEIKYDLSTNNVNIKMGKRKKATGKKVT